MAVLINQIVKLWLKYWYVFAEGLWGTLWMSAVSIFFAVVLGTFLATLKLSRFKLLGWFVDFYLWIVRGTPILLQLYFFWLGLPKILLLELSDTTCVLSALIFNASAYICEVIRSGIQAVDFGQAEGAKSLGMSGYNTMTRIILPQAVKNILPALGSEFISMIKQTSLASVFFVPELMTAQKSVQSATFLSLQSLIIAGVIYLAVTSILTAALRVYERRLGRSERNA